MAQDVQRLRPGAVSGHSSGFLMVDYTQIDVAPRVADQGGPAKRNAAQGLPCAAPHFAGRPHLMRGGTCALAAQLDRGLVGGGLFGGLVQLDRLSCAHQ